MGERTFAIFGLGISNLSVIRALKSVGEQVSAWDDNEAARDKAENLGANIHNLDVQTLAKCKSLILAPGVPYTYKPHAAVIAAQNAGIDIICDIELRYSQGWACKTVGITGTNGKSTTTALIGHVLKTSGIDAAIGGNIGTPIFGLDIPGKDGVLVLELSSYQIDLCPTFKPDIGVLLNITPDHLDRHGTMDEYAAAKGRMFEGQGAAIITGEDDHSEKIKQKTKRKLLNYPKTLPEQPALKGAHNIQNMQAAYAVCKHLGLSHDQIMQEFKTFPGLPHRQFKVRTIGNVDYINDSKATNAEATSKALSSFEDIYWIVGGKPKDGGLNGLEPLLPRIKKAYLIGESEKEFAAWFDFNSFQLTPPPLREGGGQFMRCGTIDIAVHLAHHDAQQAGKGVVLLSPAAASFDQYKNFEERGAHFSQMVEGLKP